VLETSETGAEILCLIVPAGNCLAFVELRWGIGPEMGPEMEGFRIVVNFLERDIVIYPFFCSEEEISYCDGVKQVLW
jgi:hypothetical protein